MSRQVCQAAQSLIKSFEQLRLVAYLPTPNDVLTIGYGHTGKDVTEGLVWTKERAEEVFQQDIAERAEELYFALDYGIRDSLTDNQFGALVSFVYNEGISAFKSSTMLRLINTRQYEAASEQFPRWIYQGDEKLGGLIRRRAAERALFDTP